MAFLGAGLFSWSRRRRQRARRKLLIVAAAVIGLGAAAVAATAYSNLYVFGDSLSDTGNFSFAHPGNTPPASSPGYSNGQWILDLAGQLGLAANPTSTPGGTNYAYGGALITGPSVVDGFTVPSVGDQIQSYLANAPGGHADGDALYVVQAGPANTAGGDGGAAAGAALAGLVGQLVNAGARNLLVVTPPGSPPGGNPFLDNLLTNLPVPPGGPGGGGGGGGCTDGCSPPPTIAVLPQPDVDPVDPPVDPDPDQHLADLACEVLGTCPRLPTQPTIAALVGDEVPEPATLALLGLGTALLLGRRRRPA